LKYPSVGCFYRPMGVPNPSARTYSVQTGGNAKPSRSQLTISSVLYLFQLDKEERFGLFPVAIDCAF